MKAKQNYEMPVILSPRFTQEEAEKYLNDTIVSYMKANKVEVLNIENGGKITLAYPIKKEDDGFFYTIYFCSQTSILSTLTKHFNLQKEILRYMIFKQDGVAIIKTKPAVETKRSKEEGKPSLDIKPKRVKKVAKVPIKEIDKKLEDIFKETL